MFRAIWCINNSKIAIALEPSGRVPALQLSVRPGVKFCDYTGAGSAFNSFRRFIYASIICVR